MTVRQPLLIGIIIFSSFACKVKKDVTQTISEKPEEIINMRKTACFGTCPVYTLSVFSDHTLVFNGKKYTSKLGLHEKTLLEADFNRLISNFNSSDFMTLDEDYPTNVSDVPSTIIIYNKGGETKSVRSRSNGPESFKELAKQLDDIANSENWKDLTSAEGTETDDVENQLILQLNKEVNMEQWSKKFEHYGFKVIRRISPKLNYWLAGFDLEKIDKNAMLRELLKQEEVKNAEFNRKVYIR